MCRILLVEDAQIIREPLARLLAGEGFEVCTAADGAEAMAHLQEGTVDLILLDVMMPRMDGVAFLSALRATSELRHVPVIGLTGISDTSRLARLREMGVVTILHKVRFTFEGLVGEIRRHLGEAVLANPGG